MMQLGGDHYPQMLAYCVTPWSSTLAKKHSPHQPTRLEAAADGPHRCNGWRFLDRILKFGVSSLHFSMPLIFLQASMDPSSCFHVSP
jgi:hypothetical protein